MFSKSIPGRLLTGIGIGVSLIASTLMLPTEKAQASLASGFSKELFERSNLNYTLRLQVEPPSSIFPITVTENWNKISRPHYLAQAGDQFSWTKVSGRARDIGIGGDRSVWILGGSEDSNGNAAVYRRSGSDWERIGYQDGWGAGIGIDAGPNGLVAIFNRQGDILILNYGNWGKASGGQARGISIGGDSSIWILGWNPYTDSAGVFRGYRVWKFDRTVASNWRPYDVYGVAIDVAPGGTPWIVNKQGEISYLDLNNNKWIKVPDKKARQIGIGGDRSVWIVGWDFNSEKAGYPIYRKSGSGWEFTNAYGVAIDVAPGGTPWIVNQRGEIYYGTKALSSRSDSCNYPGPDRIVERLEREEAKEIPINVRNDVRLTISKTMLLYDPDNKGIDQRDLLVVEGVKRREACTEPECLPGETYDAWHVTARTAFWDPTCAQKWRDAGKPETWQCQWVPDEASRGTYIAVKRWADVALKYAGIGISNEEQASIARVICSP